MFECLTFVDRFRTRAFRLGGCTPTNLTFNVYKDDDGLRGTSTGLFTGGLSNVVCDGVTCLTGAYHG